MKKIIQLSEIEYESLLSRANLNEEKIEQLAQEEVNILKIKLIKEKEDYLDLGKRYSKSMNLSICFILISIIQSLIIFYSWG